MIGILLITHGSYGEALVRNVCHVLNRTPAQLDQLALTPQDDPLDLLPEARRRLQQVDTGEGVLVLTDLFGASPANLAQKLLVPGRVEGLAGVNLPMLLRAVSYRSEPLDALVARALVGGTQGVMQVGAAAPQNQNRRPSHDQEEHHHQQ